MEEKESDAFTQEELRLIAEDLSGVLTKHGATMGVVSTINISKAKEEVSKEVTEEKDGN
tara:strand:- start:976 stop:1152 length:177 start_codon:yes stop_codon:yes gene_type:complete